jgi:hypothetical protein
LIPLRENPVQPPKPASVLCGANAHVAACPSPGTRSKRSAKLEEVAPYSFGPTNHRVKLGFNDTDRAAIAVTSARQAPHVSKCALSPHFRIQPGRFMSRRRKRAYIGVVNTRPPVYLPSTEGYCPLVSKLSAVLSSGGLFFRAWVLGFLARLPLLPMPLRSHARDGLGGPSLYSHWTRWRPKPTKRQRRV